MAVNLRKKYLNNRKSPNRAFKYQLDYMHNGKRIRETVKDIVFLPSDSKEVKKQKQRVIDKIRADLEIELANQSNGIISRKLKKASFIEFFQSIAETKSPNTKVAWDNTLKHIISFNGKKLKFEDVNEHWIQSFTLYLLKHLSQNSTRTYLQKVSTALNLAVRQKIISSNPFQFLQQPKKEEKEMTFLTKGEIEEIIGTDFFNTEVKNAFLFGCFTGLRFGDIQNLKWMDIKDGNLRISQNKTKGMAYIPLNVNAHKILQLQPRSRKYIFDLFEHNSSVNRTLKKLIKKTGIDKEVSFHSSRHTFATLLISSGANIYTVSKLLGHKDIQSTLVYAKVIDEEKDKAVNDMPSFY